MPTFIRPARVVVDEGGAGLAVVAVVAIAVAFAVVASVLGDIVLALAIAAVVAVAGSLAILAAVLRRNRAVLYTPEPPQAVPDLRSPAVGASRPAAVEGARPTALLGIVLSSEAGLPGAALSGGRRSSLLGPRPAGPDQPDRACTPLAAGADATSDDRKAEL